LITKLITALSPGWVEKIENKKDRWEKMNELMLQIIALILTMVLGVATVYGIRLYLEI